jgi:hypothetical protein
MPRGCERVACLVGRFTSELAVLGMAFLPCHRQHRNFDDGRINFRIVDHPPGTRRVLAESSARIETAAKIGFLVTFLGPFLKDVWPHW